MKFILILILILVVIWILFLNVNPYTINQNKYSILKYIPKQYTGDIDIYNSDKNYKFPLIIKPITCTKKGINVKKINNVSELYKYKKDFMTQDFIPYENEVGILYEKDIITGKGKIISMVQKKSKNGNNDILDTCSDSIECIDLTHKITPELTNIILYISSFIPNFNAGRFDIKYKNIENLLQGKDFYILEANGTLGFDLRAVNNIHTNDSIYNIYYYSLRWIIKRLLIGFKNILTLKGYDIITLLDVMNITIYNTFNCKDWEKLFALYT